MNRICIAALMTVMICGPGCGPSEQDGKRRAPYETFEQRVASLERSNKAARQERKRAERYRFEATEKLLSAWDMSEGITPRADYIRVLISEGADVSAKDDEGMTPLMLGEWAANAPEIFTLLIEAGAYVNAMDDKGKTPLMHAVGPWIPFSKTNLVVTLLIEAGADVNAKDNDGKTALMWADNPEIKKLLKAAGAKE